MSQLARQLIEENLRTRATYLDLGRCGLNGTEPELELLAECGHLETLVFANEWWEFDETTERWMEKKSFNCDNNNLLEVIPDVLPPGLSNLILRGQRLTEIKPLASLTQLVKLGLSDNQVINLEPLAKLTSLTELYLSNNKISSISCLSNLTKLKELRLRKNQITNLEPISGLCNLEKIDLSHNRIIDLLPVLNLKKLRNLNIKNNHIDYFPLSLLAYLTSLSKLILVGNPIDNIPGDLFKIYNCIMQLKDHDYKNRSRLSLLIKQNQTNQSSYLDLGNCNLVGIEPELNLLANSNHLETLILANTWREFDRGIKQWIQKNSQNTGGRNKMSLIPQTLPSELAKLVIAGQQITNPSLKALPSQLNSLDLSHNQITNLDDLPHLNKITELDFSYNKITDLNPLIRMTTLKKLHLAKNKISCIDPLAFLTKLTQLVLDENLITSVMPLAELRSLTRLRLGYNCINSIPPFMELTALTELTLNNNKLRDLPLGFPYYLTNLTSLDLRGNPFDHLLTSKVASLENCLPQLRKDRFEQRLTTIKLIDENILANNPYLDLGRCHLDGSEPELAKLAECDHITTLVLANWWYKFDNNTKRWQKRASKNHGKNNYLKEIPGRLPPNLRKLVLTDQSIENLNSLSGLRELSELDLM
jgi:Leucine-rich repeat (LRR) protein